MVKIGPVALVIASAMLTACGGTICPFPGEPKFENHTPCWYNMKVVNAELIGAERALVTATISEGVGGSEVDHNKQYKFFVHNLQGGTSSPSLKLQEGQDYLFNGGENSAYLELFVFPTGPGSMKK
jgi:hypothetical protein